MGAWDLGLFDNDTALDGLGDLTDAIRGEVLSAADSGRAAAGVGLLLQLSAFDFSSENTRADELLAAIRSVDLTPLSKEAWRR